MTLYVSPPIRGYDKHGSGHYQAPRGDRKHNGIDFSVYPDSMVLSIKAGHVSKIGYPYDPNDHKKRHFRYVQITDDQGFDARYFYVMPLVAVGQYIPAGAILGQSQKLSDVYPGITDHVHFEVKKGGAFVNPLDYLV